MNVFSRLASAINQSFRLVFVSIRRGVEFIARAIKKAITLLSTLIKRLHGFLTTVIELLINISSIIFVLFIPLAFFVDPLNWSRHLSGAVSEVYVFWGRMALGGFFALVAYFLVSGLIKIWRDSAASEGHSTEGGFVRGVAGLASWLMIFVIFVYFTVFRMQLLPIDLANAGLPEWLQALVPTKFEPTVTEMRMFESGANFPNARERKYKERFYSATTSYINWELTLKYPKRKAQTDFEIRAICYRKDGSIVAQQTFPAYVKEGWSESRHANGFGAAKPGFWGAGRYTIELSLDGNIVANRTFAVF